jgi:hypothetical protein
MNSRCSFIRLWLTKDSDDSPARPFLEELRQRGLNIAEETAKICWIS